MDAETRSFAHYRARIATTRKLENNAIWPKIRYGRTIHLSGYATVIVDTVEYGQAPSQSVRMLDSEEPNRIL